MPPQARPRRPITKAIAADRIGRGTAPPRRGARAGAAGNGVLVVIAGAEGRGKEMLVAIARRRFEADASLDFPARLTTRSQSEANGDTVVNRRVLRDMAAAGELLCRWETDGHAFGLGMSIRRSLEAGRTVVVVAGLEAAAELRRVWPDVRVIEVTAGADSARPKLGKLALGRFAPGRPAAERDGAARGATLALHHDGDVASAVRSFHEMISRLRIERLGEAAPSGRAISAGAVVKRLAGGVSPRKGLRGERPRA